MVLGFEYWFLQHHQWKILSLLQALAVDPAGEACEGEQGVSGALREDSGLTWPPGTPRGAVVEATGSGVLGPGSPMEEPMATRPLGA